MFKIKPKSIVPYVLPMVTIFLCDPFIRHETFELVEYTRDAALIFCFFITIYFLVQNRIKNNFLKFHALLLFLYFFSLLGESYWHYDLLWADRHTLLYFFPVLYMVVFYGFLKKWDVIHFLNIFAYLTCIYLYLYEIIIRIQGVSSEVYRVLPAPSVYALLFFTFYFIAGYSRRISFFYIFFIFANLFIIFLENHRTVWVSGIVTLIVYVCLIFKKSNIHLKTRLWGIVTSMIVLSLCGLMLYEDTDFIINFLAERFSEISKYKESGTGAWRYLQYEYYLPFVKEHWLSGLKFQGGQVPPLYPEMFPPDSGHHFHSDYLGILFYHGVIGFFLMYAPLLYYLVSYFKKRSHDLNHIALFSFLVSGIFYSVSYRLPYFFFALLAVGFIFLEKEELVRKLQADDES